MHVNTGKVRENLGISLETKRTNPANVFSIADDILIAGFDEQGKDQTFTLEKVFWVCRQENSKLNKDMSF